MITCAEAIKNATGKDYEVSEVDEFIKQAERIRDRINNDASIADKSKAIEDALSDAQQGMIEAAKIQKRNAMINKMRLENAIDFIQSQYDDDMNLGIKTLLVGDERVRKGSRNAVDVEQKALNATYQGGLQADLEREGVLKLVVSDAIQDDIARALAGESVANSDAVRAANVIRKYQELARKDANRSGAWIKKIDGYITRQTHDADKILNTEADTYIADLKNYLDLKKTLSGVDDEASFFSSLYSALSTGIHLSSSPKEITKAFQGNANLARKMSEGRVLHFKDADSWMAYNQKYGSGSLISTVLQGLETSANNTGLMRHLGTNPESMYDVIYDRLIRSTDDNKSKIALNEGKKVNSKYLKEVTGQTRIAGNQMGAKWSSNIRTFESTTKLGGVVLSQFGDLPVYASEVRYQGGTMISGVGEALRGLGAGRRSVEERKIAATLGVMADSLISDMNNRYGVDKGTGLIQKGANKFFKLTGMNYWSESLKVASAIGTSHRLHLESSHSYDAVNPAMKRVLTLYGINEPEWNVIRKAEEIASDGKGFITPEALQALPKNEFQELLINAGLNPTDYRISLLKDELASKLRNLVSDRQGYALLESDARNEANWNRGTQRGTLGGELLRFFSQYKKFFGAFYQRVVMRELRGKSVKTGLGVAHDSPLYGVASLITTMTALGYVSMSAKDLAKGRQPRDPLELSTWTAALVQGGGLGIYGDFLFGEMKNRFGGGALETFLGPVWGTASSVADLWGRAKSGDDFSSQLFTTMLNNTPFINLFYTRIALDYLILYDMREWLNPGYLRRYEKRLKKENDQEFFAPPSRHRMKPITN